MSRENKDKADIAEDRTKKTRGFMQQVRAASRRKYTPEEKARIVLEGFRREVAVNELCRREGIKPGAFYSWTKDFMEAGKERLTRDTVRDATRHDINELKWESTDLKQLVADLSLEVYRLKKTAIPPLEDHNGAGYLSRSFRDYLNLVGIGHILTAHFCPSVSFIIESMNGFFLFDNPLLNKFFRPRIFVSNFQTPFSNVNFRVFIYLIISANRTCRIP